MNEKIKELAEQAGATVNERSGYTDYGTLDLDVEKFAELIVQECAELCDINDKEQGNILKKHFGVDPECD